MTEAPEREGMTAEDRDFLLRTLEFHRAEIDAARAEVSEYKRCLREAEEWLETHEEALAELLAGGEVPQAPAPPPVSEEAARLAIPSVPGPASNEGTS